MSEFEFSNQPAIVELMGHQVIAGRITEEEHVGSKLLRVDVPEVNGRPAFTKFFGSSAIYGITPTDEATMLIAARQARIRSVTLYILPDRQLREPTMAEAESELEPGDHDNWTEPDRIA